MIIMVYVRILFRFFVFIIRNFFPVNNIFSGFSFFFFCKYKKGHEEGFLRRRGKKKRKTAQYVEKKWKNDGSEEPRRGPVKGRRGIPAQLD